MIKKHAGIIKQRPFGMVSASKELMSWVTGSYTEQPSLDVSYCIASFDNVAQPRMAICDNTAVALEPAMCDVVIKTQKAKAAAKPKAKSKTEQDAIEKISFINTMAASLVKDHEFSWDNALQHATRCYVVFPKKRATAVMSDGVANDCSDDEVTPVMEVEGDHPYIL
jgi:hypothetical protein